MPILTPETLNDLQISTLPAFERGRFTEIATDLREYHVFPNLILFKDDAAGARMETRDGGTRIEFDVMTNHNGASKHTSIASQDNPVKVDVLQRATVPWRFTTTQWGEFQQELAMNAGDMEKIVDIQLAQDKAALISLAVLMENTWWGPPVDSADTLTPYGCFTWFPKSASSGFLGGFPSGFTTLGLNNQHSRWKHYVDAYTDATSDDLFYKLWLAVLRTMFKNPVAGIPNLDEGVKRGTYMNTTTYVAFAREAMRQNDNVGYDLTRAQGITFFMNVPCFTVPKLDADTTNPVINLDWSTIKCIALKAWWLKRLNINNYPGQHTTNAKFIDSQYNFVCWNRRKNAVLAMGTTYPS
jgi:hypothetical protein